MAIFQRSVIGKLSTLRHNQPKAQSTATEAAGGQLDGERELHIVHDASTAGRSSLSTFFVSADDIFGDDGAVKRFGIERAEKDGNTFGGNRLIWPATRDDGRAASSSQLDAF
jgi:hypothetical protein